MTQAKSKHKSPATGDNTATATRILDAVARVLAPLVRLLIARGVTFQVVSEVLKRVYVREGLAHFAGEAAQSEPTGTQLSLLTGLNRKEIRRLTDETLQPVASESVTSFASAVHAAWFTQRRFRDKSGTPHTLPRQTKDNRPSFNELVQTVTTDHRPAAVLEELRRLKLVDMDEHGNVALRAQPFLPRRTTEDRLQQFAENLGDHAAAAVTNVLAETPPFLDRFIFSDELSQESVALLQEMAHAKWQKIQDDLISTASQREAADAKVGRTCNQRMRIGMYFYSEAKDKE
jgi:hypothetical protein